MALRLQVKIEHPVQFGNASRGDMLKVAIDQLLDALALALGRSLRRLGRSQQPPAEFPQSRRHQIGEDERIHKLGVEDGIEQVRRDRAGQVTIIHAASSRSPGWLVGSGGAADRASIKAGSSASAAIAAPHQKTE